MELLCGQPAAGPEQETCPSLDLWPWDRPWKRARPSRPLRRLDKWLAWELGGGVAVWPSTPPQPLLKMISH